MKKRTIIVFVFAAALLLGALGLGAYGRFHSKVSVRGYFKPDDLTQIQAALRYYRWQIIRSDLANRRNFNEIPDLALGRIREIFAIDDRPYKEAAPSITNPPSHALVHSDRWRSGQGPSYYLERDTNRWQLVKYGNF